RRPSQARDLDDARIRQKFGEITPNCDRRGRIRRAEVDEQYAYLRHAVVCERRFGAVTGHRSSHEKRIDKRHDELRLCTTAPAATTTTLFSAAIVQRSAIHGL